MGLGEFFEAAEQGNLDNLKKLLENDPSLIDQRDPEFNWTALMWAVYAFHNDVVEYLCTEGRASADIEDNQGKTALHVACKNGNLEATKYLVSRGANVNLMSSNVSFPWSPLMYAARYNHTKLCDYLIRCGANIDAVDIEGKSPLDLTSSDDTRSVLLGQAILANVPRAQIFIVCHDDQLSLAKSLRASIEKTSLSCELLTKDIPIEVVSQALRKSHVLIFMLSNQFVTDSKCCQIVNVADGLPRKIIVALAAAGTTFPPPGVLGAITAGQLYQDLTGTYTPIEEAIDTMTKTIEDHMLNSVTVTAQSEQTGQSSAEEAAREKRLRLAAIQSDPSLTVGTRLYAKGGCPKELIEACEHGNLQTVIDVLTAKPHVVDLCDSTWEWTPLLWTVYGGHMNIVQYLLLQAKANPNLIDRNGKGAIHVAAKYDRLEILKFLIDHGGIDINFLPSEPIDAWTPLQFAANHEREDIVKALLERGAHKLLVDRAGHCAADYTKSATIKHMLHPDSAYGKKDSAACDVFLSYNWGQQSLAKDLRSWLEKEIGVTVWMDIGEMGSGDALFTAIDNGLRRAHVVVSCVSPAYIASANCLKEVSLLVGLKKPLIPIFLENKVPQFPPPGRMGTFMTDWPQPLPLFDGDAVKAEFGEQVKRAVAEAKQAASLSNIRDITHRRFGEYDKRVFDAATDGDVEALRQLILHGADPDAREPEWEWTPLMYAIWKNQSQVVKFLCSEVRVNTNLVDKNGKSPLHVAVKYGNLDACRYLVEFGADIDFVVAKPIDSWTPLMYAAANSQPEIAAFLLRCNANPTKLNKAMKLAVDVSESEEVTALLKSRNPLIAGLPDTDPAFAGSLDEPREIFISYGGAQREIAREIAKCLATDLSVGVFFDEGQFDVDWSASLLEKASVSRARMDKAVRQARVVLALVSTSFSRDPVHQRELLLAEGLKKPIISAIVDLNASFPPEGPLGPVLAPESVLKVINDDGSLTLADLVALVGTKLQGV